MFEVFRILTGGQWKWTLENHPPCLHYKQKNQDEMREKLEENKNKKNFTKRVMRSYNTKRRLEHKQSKLDRFMFKRQQTVSKMQEVNTKTSDLSILRIKWTVANVWQFLGPQDVHFIFIALPSPTSAEQHFTVNYVQNVSNLVSALNVPDNYCFSGCNMHLYDTKDDTCEFPIIRTQHPWW